ncbi:MAG: response regulator [Candidatus Korobacteraceae bacterium]
MPFKILLADDSMTAQNMARKILSEAGYEIVTVSNGAAALKKIAETAPDLVILDIYMPGYSGFEVCERVKRASANTPVLLSVGKLEPYREEDALAVRANGVIVKPFEASELIATVEKVMPGAGAPGKARTGDMEIAASPAASGEKYPAPPFEPVVASYPAATPGSPADAKPAPGTQSTTSAAFAPAFPAEAASESPFDRDLPAEVSQLTQGLGSFPSYLPEEPQGLSAKPGYGARLQVSEGGDPVSAKAAAMGVPRADDGPPVPFALDDLLNAVREGQPAAAVRPASRAQAAPPAGGVAPGPPPSAVSPLPLPKTAAPATANAPFSEAEFGPAALSSAPFAREQAQSQVETGQLDAPAGFTSKWRIEVRPTSPPPSTAEPPAITNDDDLLIELMPEFEPQARPGPDQTRAAGRGSAGAAAPRQAPAPAMDSAPTPRVPSTGTQPIALDFGLPQATPPAGANDARGPANGFSAPRMLEATAAMSFPEQSGAEQPAIIPAAGTSRPGPAAASPQAERQEPGRHDHPVLDSALVTAAVQRALDRYKPLIVAEILRELNK